MSSFFLIRVHQSGLGRAGNTQDIEKTANMTVYIGLGGARP